MIKITIEADTQDKAVSLISPFVSKLESLGYSVNRGQVIKDLPTIGILSAFAQRRNIINNKEEINFDIKVKGK